MCKRKNCITVRATRRDFFYSSMKNTLNYLTLQKFCTVFKISNYTKKFGARYYILETLLHVVSCLDFPNSIWLQRFACKTFNFPKMVFPFHSDGTTVAAERIHHFWVSAKNRNFKYCLSPILTYII